MIWTVALLVFIAQLLCCLLLEGRVKKYLPTLIAAAVMVITILGGSLGIIRAVLLMIEGAALAMGGLAIGIYQLAMWKRRK